MKTEAYINKIIEDTELSKKDIQSLIEEKKEELRSLISEEGALFLIAKELGTDIMGSQSVIVNEKKIEIGANRILNLSNLNI